MRIVFDMDNTLSDEMGATIRPGITGLLERLINEGHTLILWTNSGRVRARQILRDHDLLSFFSECLFREDYDMENRGIPKDIRKVKGDILIDDDPSEVKFVQSIGKKAFRIKPYRKNAKVDENELKDLYRFISSGKGIFKRLFSK